MKEDKNLYYLEELSNYVVDDNDKDVRGWPVKDNDGRKIGEVDNLLVNKETERVVYLDVEVDSSIIDKNHDPNSTKGSSDGVHEFVNDDGENHLIIPIGLAHLNLDDEIVYSNEIDYNTFAETKRIRKGDTITRDYEIIVLKTYDKKRDSDYPRDQTLYKDEAFRYKN